MTSFSRRSVWPLLALFSFSASCFGTARADNATSVPPKPEAAALVTAGRIQEAFVGVANRLKPSVVTIYCEHIAKPAKLDPKTGKPEAAPAPDDDEDEDPAAPGADPSEPRTSLGTGMVVSSDGYVVTNYHVVKGADVVRVLFNADTEDPDRPLAKVVGYDEESDLAVLKVPRENLAFVEFADSDEVRIGEWAMAIGAPFDQPLTVTVGIVSAKGRHLDKKGRQGLQDYIQTDASINPGNSGGPLIDIDGKVVGVNTAILSPSRFNVGIGFSVPSNTVKRLLPILLKGDNVKRGFLGIQYVKIDPQVAQEWGVPGGVQIGALAKKDGTYIGPAKDAGLREDDIITAVDDVSINSSDRFRAMVAGNPPGTKMKFSVARPGKDKAENFEVMVTLGDWAAQFGAPKTVPVKEETAAPVAVGLGLEVDDPGKLNGNDKLRFGVDAKSTGAVVTKITPGTPADEADLRRGLRIVRVRVSGAGAVGEWQPINDAVTWRKLEKTTVGGSHILIQLRDKDDVSVYKVIEVPKAEPAGVRTAQAA